jgi:uncharacterized membrane protein
MPTNRFPRLLLSLLLVIATIQTIHYYPRLPVIVASHFGGRGEPNGWSSKQFFFELYWAILALFALLPVGASKLLANMPISLINLPNKEYWLAPERRDETVTDFQCRMSFFSAATMALMIAAIDLALRANLAGDRRFSAATFLMVLAAYATFVIYWLVQLFHRFEKSH